MTTRSEMLFAEAQDYIPGGVNSPVRAFRGVGGTPLFFKRGQGAYLYDEDDRRYIDYVGSWGPMIAGHAHPAVVAAVREAAGNGLSFGAPTAIETTMARRIRELVPSMERVRMCNSGTEATMSAIRLARGYTGRDTIIKFEGCYHGHSDSLLVKAGSGALTLGVPTSPGVPAALAAHTVTLSYNDLAMLGEAFATIGPQVAGVIVEPVAGNMNCIPPAPGFLQGLRELCDQFGSVLIFDEVMTGFRVAPGGAQELYGISPDLTTLGKIIGGGMPVGAFGGRQAIMDRLAPLGPIYQAGTLSGNPVAMAAGLATLNLIATPGFHADLAAKTVQLCAGLVEAGRKSDHAVARAHAVGRLDAGDAAQRCRLADRAAGVGAGCARCQTRRDCRRRAARGATGHRVQLPGIAHRTVEAGLVGRAHGELVHVGLAEHHRASGVELFNHRGVIGGDEAIEYPRAAGRAHAIGAEDVLVRDGHTGQRSGFAARAARIGSPGLGKGALGGDGDEGVQLRIEALDTRQQGAGQFFAAERAGGQAGTELRNGFIVHGAGIGEGRSRSRERRGAAVIR